jgi:hypothetical protein
VLEPDGQGADREEEDGKVTGCGLVQSCTGQTSNIHARNGGLTAILFALGVMDLRALAVVTAGHPPGTPCPDRRAGRPILITAPPWAEANVRSRFGPLASAIRCRLWPLVGVPLFFSILVASRTFSNPPI